MSFREGVLLGLHAGARKEVFFCSVLGDLELENCTLGWVSWAYGWQYDSDKWLAACVGYMVGCIYEVGNMVGCMGWPGLWLAA